MGMPPMMPETMFAAPCARSSRFNDDIRLYGSSRSAASSATRVSRLAASAMVAAAIQTRPVTDHGEIGNRILAQEIRRGGWRQLHRRRAVADEMVHRNSDYHRRLRRGQHLK
jgi:hypothetical protein